MSPPTSNKLLSDDVGVPIALDVLAHLGAAYLFLVPVVGILWFCTVVVATLYRDLKEPVDPGLDATDDNPPSRRWLLMVVAITGGLVPILIGLFMAHMTEEAGRMKDMETLAFGLPLFLVLFGCSIIWGSYRRRRKTVDEPGVTPFGSVFASRWNDLMFGYAARSVGTAHWLAAGIGAFAFVTTSEEFTRQTAHSTSPGYWPSMVAALIYGALFALLMFVRRIASPHWLMLRAHFLQARAFTGGRLPGSSTGDFRATRWRTPLHYRGFHVAKRLERCLLGIQWKVEPHDAHHVITTYRKLAMALRRIGLRTADGSSPADRYNTLFYSSVTLLTDSDLVAAANRVHDTLKDEPEPSPPESGRWRRLAVSISGALQRHWPAVQILLFVTAIVALTVSGQLELIVEALLK